MVTSIGELFVWTLRSQLIQPDDVIGFHTYHDKAELASPMQLYLAEKQQFSEAQGITWTPKNKRPEKLRDSLREIEDLLAHNQVIQVRWRSRKILQTVLSNQVCVTYILSYHSGDVEKIFIDKSFSSKQQTDFISDAYLSDQFFLTVYPDKGKLDFAYFTKRPPLGEALKKIEKMSTWEPKTSQIDIPGPIGRRLDRKLSINTRQDTVLLWWPTSSDDAMPWSPMNTEKERANLIILSIHGPNIQLLTYTRSECDPIHVEFSFLQPHRFFTVEEARGAGTDASAQTCTYEIIRGKIQRTNVTSVPVKGHLLCQGRNPTEDKLVLGCGDGSLLLINEHKKSVSSVRTPVVACDIAWHPNGFVLFIVSSRGDVQMFDMALTPLKLQLVTEEPQPDSILQINKFFKFPLNIQKIVWCPFDPNSADWCGDLSDGLFIVSKSGPPMLFLLHLGAVSRERMSALELIKEYIKLDYIAEAITLLESLNWDTHGSMAYSSLSTIINYLLHKPLNAEREHQLEYTMGIFYDSKRGALSESVIMDYRDPMSRLARRFFHHLLRYSRFDKAFLLAVDIGARDLFMDIHYMALDKGETALADVAKRKADAIESESIESYDDFEDDLVLNGIDDHISNIQQRQLEMQNMNGQDLFSGHMNGSNLPFDIDADLIQDYTAGLQLNTSVHQTHTNRIYGSTGEQHHSSHGNHEFRSASSSYQQSNTNHHQASLDQDGDNEEDVNVIHFGIV